MKTYYGADISRWQGVVDWNAFNPGASFVFIKAGGGDEGNYIDSQFAANKAGVRALGNDMPHGFYWFLQGNDPVGEANFFLSNVADDLMPGEVIALDCEKSAAVNPGVAKQWLDIVSATIGFKPILYMSDNTILTHDWSAVADANYGLWVADWAISPADNVPLKYWPFYALQQYEDNGHFPGIENGTGNVDADAFFANDIIDFYKYGKPTIAPAPPVATPPATVQPPVTSPPTPPTQPTTPPADPQPPLPAPPVDPVPPSTNPLPEPSPVVPDSLFVRILKWLEHLFETKG